MNCSIHPLRYYLVVTLLFSVSGLFAGEGFNVEYRQGAGGSQELVFNIHNYSISHGIYSGTEFATISFGNRVVTRRKGFAELPYVHASVMIDARRNVSIKVIPGEYEEVRLDYALRPSRGIIYRNQDPDAIPYQTDPKSIVDAWYPGDLAQASDPYILRDIRGVNVYVYPFQYNAATHTLRIYRHIEVQLIENMETPVNPLLSDGHPILREMDAIYRAVFINYGQGSREDLTVDEVGDILVITTDRDEAAIQPYVTWKREKGYHVDVQVVPVMTVVNPIVQDAYDQNNDLLYVLLVGDWDDIRCNTTSFGSPMDPQVGCVVGSDDYADISVGRLSANSSNDVTVQVDKIINYEKYPDMGATWYATATGIASSQGAGIGDDGEIDYEHNDVIWNDKLDPFTFETYNPIYDPGANSAMVTTAVENGTSLINYTGHGSGTSWGTSGFSISQVAALTNGDMLPWIVSVACDNGDFHTGTCFAEAWTRKSGGGAVMFLGASISQPWDPPMRGQDYFMDVLIGGYDYDTHPGQDGISTTEQRTTLGSIIFNGLTLMCTESGGSDDWETAKTWNIFGDPAMQVRTAEPDTLEVSNMMVFAGIPFVTFVNVSGNPVVNAMVALSQDGQYYRGFTDASGMVVIDHGLVPGEARLVITGFNTETIYENVSVMPPEGPYVTLASVDVDDSAGNSDGQLDYAETVFLTVGLTNVGVDDATDVVSSLSSPDSLVTLMDTLAGFGTITPGDTVFVQQAFQLMAHDSIPDLHEVNFTLTSTGNTDMTWLGSFSLAAHAPDLEYLAYSIDDEEGNGNGNLDPGETALMTISVINNGSSGAYQAFASLFTGNPYITITEDSLSYGDIMPGDTASGCFTIDVDPLTPAGEEILLSFNLQAMYGIEVHQDLSLFAGQIPVLVIDMDQSSSSMDAIMQCLENLEVQANTMDAVPGSLGLYSSVFICLGTYPNNHVLTEDEGQALAVYLENGGRVYMEGGDTWYYDQLSDPTPVHPMFHISGIEDGSGDLSEIDGQAGSIADGLSYAYSGDNSYIDRIVPGYEAVMIFNNSQPVYGCGVSYDAGTYRTVGVSFEFGGLDDGDFTRDELMIRILDFFGIEGTWTGLHEGNVPVAFNSSVYPNPAKDKVTFQYFLASPREVILEIYNAQGQKIYNRYLGWQKEGAHATSWDIDPVNPDGMYYYRFVSGDTISVGKIIRMSSF